METSVAMDISVHGGITPVERHGVYWVKRDDLASYPGGYGGKARTCWILCKRATTGVVTAGARSSPQAAIVAKTAKVLGLSCRVHMPVGERTDQGRIAERHGAEIIEHHPGRNSVIIARARDDAAGRGWTYIPFGMECGSAVRTASVQSRIAPLSIRRVVVPVGSGMTLAGVMHGLWHRPFVKYLGVVVGADPKQRLSRWGPPLWQSRTTLVTSKLDYATAAPNTVLDGIDLDPIYEAKCLPFLKRDDLFWIVGVRSGDS